MEFYFEDDSYIEKVDIVIPNAVFNLGLPLTFRITTIYIPEISTDPIVWELQSAKLFMGKQLFVENIGLNDFVKNSSTIEFPHELFSSSNEDLMRGPVSVELVIGFPENDTLLHLNGTIFFYGCEDINDDFNPEDCRWPEQVVSGLSYFHSC